MGRAHRIHLPGSAFHIVARTQGHEPWFKDDIRSRIADTLLAGAASVGARPMAFAVMSNHFHLILLQGASPLGETMQPIMRRIALIVQRRNKCEGHVFERRYRSKVCRDSEHLPNAILYVHRNPVAAHICSRPTDYPWSSAKAYENLSPPGFVCVEDGLRVFDPDGCASIDDARSAYRDRLKKVPDSELDEYWNWFWRRLRRKTDGAIVVARSPHAHRAVLADLRDVAIRILRMIDADVDIELVRSRYGGPRVARVRAELIAALLQRGFRNVAIARYLRISEATVSRIKSRMRWTSVAA